MIFSGEHAQGSSNGKPGNRRKKATHSDNVQHNEATQFQLSRLSLTLCGCETECQQIMHKAKGCKKNEVKIGRNCENGVKSARWNYALICGAHLVACAWKSACFCVCVCMCVYGSACVY